MRPVVAKLRRELQAMTQESQSPASAGPAHKDAGSDASSFDRLPGDVQRKLRRRYKG